MGPHGLDCVAGHLASTAQATASVVAVLSCAATAVCGTLIRDNNVAEEKVAAVGTMSGGRDSPRLRLKKDF